MQKVKWTEQQQRAIDERGRNILVAAAAGSGKTAVLVERIKKLILEENVPIDRMLVVTFTNAAAAEMKEKIRQALYREIEREPSHAREMRRQLDLHQYLSRFCPRGNKKILLYCGNRAGIFYLRRRAEDDFKRGSPR